MYCACMPNVQIREVPEDVHEALVRKAELAGQSLQQYLSAQLVVIASTPTVDEVIDLIERRQKGSVSRASTIASLRDERARR
jgi:antitoxin FitA